MVNKTIAGISSALANFDSLPDSAYIRKPVLKQILAGRSDASIYRDVNAGRLPPPVALGPRCSGWQVGPLRLALAAMNGSDEGREGRKAQATEAAKAGAAKRKATAVELAGQG